MDFQSIVGFGLILLMVTLMLYIGWIFGISRINDMLVPMFFSVVIGTVIYAIWLADMIVRIDSVNHVLVHAFVFTVINTLLYLPIIALTAYVLRRKGRIV